MPKVEVRPLPIKKWHEKEGKESFAQPITLEVLFDGRTGKFATGLSPEEEKEYGEKLGGANLSALLPPDKPHPYFSTQAAAIKLPNHTITFNTEIPTDFVKVKNLKASKFVANSLREWEQGGFPDATHFIYDETDEVEIKATKFQRKVELSALISAMSDDEKMSLIQIVAERSVRGKSKNFLDGILSELVDDASRLDELIKYAKLDKAELYTRGAVLEAIHRRVLIKEGTAIYYMGDKIASDVEDAIKWFLDPENQKQKVVILKKLTTV